MFSNILHPKAYVINIKANYYNSDQQKMIFYKISFLLNQIFLQKLN